MAGPVSGEWIGKLKKKDRALDSSPERRIQSAAKGLRKQRKTQLEDDFAGELQLACGQG